MKKVCAILSVFVLLSVSVPNFSYAESNATRGEITGKTVLAGLTSLIIWPGIGQYVNDCEKEKNITHAIVGLVPIFRFWSGWDALVDRQGGYWEGRV